MCYNDIACMCGGMVDAPDSKSGEGNFMWVQVPPHAPNGEETRRNRVKIENVLVKSMLL